MVRGLTSRSAHARLIEMVFLSAIVSIVSTLHCDIATTHGRPARTGPLNTACKTYRHRVTEATATAQGRPSNEHPSRYTRRVSDGLAVAVDCYAGHQGDETPRRFTRGDQLVEILAVVAQWRTRDHRYFRVRMQDETCTLRQDVTSGGWELTEVEGSAPR